ncbi:hypothetical protein EVAR_48340_1 [Eumeta japonica]|uniref:Uncharacterized protein n=1 Tax=Eumeta variegata TaxID=151549 RepID=A0A4C1WIK6_EUMVA|nr:hypothetical protein EVAR_48340_1 [Eumeta japonica]
MYRDRSVFMEQFNLCLTLREKSNYIADLLGSCKIFDREEYTGEWGDGGRNGAANLYAAAKLTTARLYNIRAAMCFSSWPVTSSREMGLYATNGATTSRRVPAHAPY